MFLDRASVFKDSKLFSQSLSILLQEGDLVLVEVVLLYQLFQLSVLEVAVATAEFKVLFTQNIKQGAYGSVEGLDHVGNGFHNLPRVLNENQVAHASQLSECHGKGEFDPAGS